MFKTLILLYALSFWVTECTPNPGWSFPHWLAHMLASPVTASVLSEPDFSPRPRLSTSHAVV